MLCLDRLWISLLLLLRGKVIVIALFTDPRWLRCLYQNYPELSHRGHTESNTYIKRVLSKIPRELRFWSSCFSQENSISTPLTLLTSFLFLVFFLFVSRPGRKILDLLHSGHQIHMCATPPHFLGDDLQDGPRNAIVWLACNSHVPPKSREPHVPPLLWDTDDYICSISVFLGLSSSRCAKPILFLFVRGPLAPIEWLVLI